MVSISKVYSVTDQLASKAFALVRRVHHEEIKVPGFRTSSRPISLREDGCTFENIRVYRVGSAIIGRICRPLVRESYESISMDGTCLKS